MNPLYIIPARGGSKGIPRKNIKELAGKPLVAYAIEQAIEAKFTLGGYVLLSSDDEEIAEVARFYGLAVDYMRPAELATDTAGSREMMLDAMAWADAVHIDYDCVILLQPTSPLRNAQDILDAARLYTQDVDMVVSVCKTEANPYYHLFELTDDGTLHICKGDGLYTRRQDAPEVLEYNGAVYVVNPESLRKMPMGSFPKRIPYLMPASRSIDLDTLEDWRRAEELISNNEF